ncbi:hypothetical protein BU23DRAFT_503303 [Bimuria novae-zelandiae CBS 107.79]|uniref:MYND-type domain-containing protein n=1 Tax=Bimuria novae-zelandiae CBS 107.79 TaxID=1447943 RepID=A0A6A5VK91_9PLEO|nr:hypothetical protein BU23DRAFT_503303 [Bimuria novae-zelandiae CBS 107.79]
MPAKCKDRERIAASGNADVPSLPVGAIRGDLCFRCFSPLDDILKCSGCRRAYYCSEKCQKSDWKLVHKNHCKIFQTINQVEEEKYQRSRTWAEYRESLLFIIRIIRNAAPRDDNLRYIVQAQAYCTSCRRTVVQLATRKIVLNRCTKCRLVFSCADCSSTPEHPASICEIYQHFRRTENFRINFFEDTGKATPVTCTQFPRDTRKSLADATGWFDYYVKISDKPQIDGKFKPGFSSIEIDIDRNGSDREKDEAERMLMFLLCATDTLTMPLTIAQALEDIQWEKPHLNVHIVGATDRELVLLANFEELLHLIPSLRDLHITAIGPEIPGPSENDSFILSRQSLDCCPPCKSGGRERSISLYRGVYHDYCKDPKFERPDLVVLFNSRWVDGDDAKSHWEPTIKKLVADNVPALFTTYNSGEARNEQQRMKELGANFVIEVEENKWKGLVPTPEFIDEEYGMWYNNAYRYIIQGSK